LEGFAVIQSWKMSFYGVILAVGIAGWGSALGQTENRAPAPPAPATPPPAAYQPRFPGDPARSDSEAKALGYMRVVLRAQRDYKKRHSKYAESLAALAGTGSFTKRMAAKTDRDDYTVSFGSQPGGFVLTMTPKQMDAEHRSFYAEGDGWIHADDQKAADMESPKIK
jgi:hypothetical protein